KMFGTTRALDGIDLDVPAGSVFGFLGPNGAGKSTALNILAGLSRPTAGSARIFGHDVTTTPDAVRALIGYLPDVPGFYGWMTGAELLRFSGELFGLRGRELDERVVALIDLAGLTGVETLVGGYSRGMRQRLGMAQALINAPRLLLLDEPTSALDPIGRKNVLDMIAALAGRTTIFFSTHILADVQRVCDRVAILDRGRVVIEAPIDALLERAGPRDLRLELGSPEDAATLAAAVVGSDWLVERRLEGTQLVLTVTDLDAALRAVPGLVSGRGLLLRRLEPVEASLEQVFVDLIGEDGR
ncbi:MAG TPA: ABC transporter ATP-binding protein, partial [Thermomicrobiales bacterium]|nr:ABC transporter ATP-binding protein [Thermomicrobiales bacterium]